MAMTTIDWTEEPQSEDERALRAEVIKVVTEDGFAALGGNGGWSFVHLNLWKLCDCGERLAATDLREAIRHAKTRADEEFEARRVQDVEGAVARARARLKGPSPA